VVVNEVDVKKVRIFFNLEIFQFLAIKPYIRTSIDLKYTAQIFVFVFPNVYIIHSLKKNKSIFYFTRLKAFMMYNSTIGNVL
jgi:hypothetical protein